MRETIIISFAIAAIIISAILFIWSRVFGRPVWRMMFMMLGVWQNKGSLVDPQAEIVPSREKYSSQVLEERAAMAKQALPFEAPQAPPIAELSAENNPHETTSDSGWPRELDYETRHEPHPFRHVHLETDTEKTHKIMDVDTYNPPENETDSQAQ